MNATSATSDRLSRDAIERCFNVLVSCTNPPRRCPMNGREGVESDLVSLLARAGRIKVEISGRNWRQITILDGPHKGKQTLANPHKHRVWKTLDKDGAHTDLPRLPERQQPSPPRLLTTNG